MDRRLPIALLLAIGVQSGTAVWWAASISSRVESLEKRVADQSGQSERLVRVEEKVTTLHDSLQEKANQLRESINNGLDDLKRLVLAQMTAKPPAGRGDR